MPEYPTIAHVTLTVSDLDRTVPWYEQLFDSTMLRDDSPGPYRRAILIIGGGSVIGFNQFPDPADSLPFNERRVGLDHLSFACDSRGELETWQARLDELGIFNRGVVDASYGSALSFRDPDNIALEFFAPPS